VERTSYYENLHLDVDYAGDADFAASESRRLYLRAVAEAPDNPNFPAYAELVGVADWRDIFRAALARFPDHSYATMMSYRLFVTSQTLEEQSAYGRLYERAAAALLRSSAQYRPGYLPMPVFDASAPPTKSRGDGVEVTLEPGRVDFLRPTNAFNSD